MVKEERIQATAVFVKWHHDRNSIEHTSVCPNIVNRHRLVVPTSVVLHPHHREHHFDLIIFLRLELITKGKGSVSCAPHHHELHRH